MELDAAAVATELTAKMGGVQQWLATYVGPQPGPGMELSRAPNQRGAHGPLAP